MFWSRLLGGRREPETQTLLLGIREGGTLDDRLKELIAALGNRPSSDNSEVLNAINNLNRKVDQFMATQEERLQAILVAVKNVKQMLADLKANNPAIEDEIAAIETELAPTPDPAPGGDEGGGETPA